ncbi:9638_t:CDS:1, partial [Acaulospora colombiana]
AQGKEIFNRSRLPVEMLAHVWALADGDKSGNLTLSEFIIAMYLIKYLMDKKPKQLPAFVPPWLLAEASKGGSNTAPTLSNGMTTLYPAPAGPPPNHNRSQSQPPQPSLLDADDATIDAIARPATTSPRPGAPNLGSIHGRSRSDYLNRPTPPPPLPHRVSDDAPPPYVEWEPSPRVQV